MQTKLKQKLFSKKVFGVPAFLIALAVMSVGVSAAVLSYYGTVQQTFTIAQSVLLSGDTTFAGSATGGDTQISEINTLINNANNPVVVKFSTDVRNPSDITDGVVTTYQGVLQLSSKNTDTWAITPDKKATLYYSISGSEFKYKVDTTNDLSGYIVVYYPDISETKPWNIANAVNLGVVSNDWTTSTLTTSLPITGDYNANPNEGNSYCDKENTYDSYTHCSGAKIWIMPAEDLGNWSPTNWLFETDLISYSANGNNELTLPANGGGVNFEVINNFAANLVPGTYNITTYVLPQ